MKKDNFGWEDGFPNLEEIKEGQRGRTNAWILLVAKLMRFVVPDAKDCIAAKPLNKWSTVASEALLFLNLENCHDAWKEEEVMKEEDDDTDLVSGCLHTDHEGAGKRFGGWDNTGIKRFNEICENVKKQRTHKKCGAERDGKGANERDKIIGFA